MYAHRSGSNFSQQIAGLDCNGASGQIRSAMSGTSIGGARDAVRLRPLGKAVREGLLRCHP